MKIRSLLKIGAPLCSIAGVEAHISRGIYIKGAHFAMAVIPYKFVTSLLQAILLKNSPLNLYPEYT